MTVVFQTGVDFDNMGYWANKLAGEGKIIDAFIVFGISGVLFSLMITIIMHFIAKIFTNFCNRFSTLNAICDVLDCQPGDILEFQKDQSNNNTK